MNTSFKIPTLLKVGENQIKELPSLIANRKKCLLVTTQNIAPLDSLYEQVISLCTNESNVKIIHFDKVVPNPTSQIIDEGIKVARDENIDCIIALGGGSTLDVAKTIRLLQYQDYAWDEVLSTYQNPFESYDTLNSNDTLYIAIPTTSGTGSEVTQAAVITHNELKQTIFHPQNFSDIAILDPTLLLTLPNSITASTTFDAFTHAFESLISSNSTSMSQELALSAIQIIVENLPLCLKDNNNITIREKLLVAQNIAGISLANGGANLPHPISEIIGSYAKIPHGESLAIVFPSFVKFSYDKYENQYERVRKIFAQNSSEENLELDEYIRIFIEKIGLKSSFSAYDLSDEVFEKILNDELWGYLPFASESSIKKVILASK